jgi:hypothetical protein
MNVNLLHLSGHLADFPVYLAGQIRTAGQSREADDPE